MSKNDLRDVLRVAEDVILSLPVGMHLVLADTRCLILDHATALDPQLQEGLEVSVQLCLQLLNILSPISLDLIIANEFLCGLCKNWPGIVACAN